MTKPREKTREELQAEIEDGKKKIRQFENREKMLRQKLSKEERRTRSHRLIVRGAVFESIATLCYRELHGIAVNFLKNYMAVALQGAVLYLVIGFYPALTASLGSGGDITEQAWAMLGKSVILLVAVFMSGRFTKAITSAI